MTASKSLPARPSRESLHKQAKKLARDIAAGDAGAIARARVHLPHLDLPLTQRNAQLVVAREYGYAGWQDLIAEVSKRLGTGLERAVAQARRIIHDNDVDGLTQLLAEYPALLSWQGNDWDSQGGLLGIATGAYGDAGDPERERWFTRAACAELLIDAGAVVTPSVCQGLIESRARGLLQLFEGKGLLPRTLEFLAALGDLDAVRSAVDENGHDLPTINQAFVCACRFEHETAASLLLERSIALDPELGKHIDGSTDRVSFIRCFRKADLAQAAALGLWQVFVMDQVSRAAHDGDATAFVATLQRERWLLDDAYVEFQAGLIGAATLNDRGEILTALLALEPALLRRQPPPQSQAIEFAFTYAKPHLIPLLTRIWPLPDDLPHAAGMGDLARVKRWFDKSGAPALGDLDRHYPCNSPHARRYDDLQWGPPRPQHVLDTALAWSVINRHFDVADFLLEHGANVSTNWNSHEPASILHHLVFLPNPYESMQFLIDHGIDMTIEDYRWNATALGWARVAAKDEKMAQWLEEAERPRQARRTKKKQVLFVHGAGEGAYDADVKLAADLRDRLGPHYEVHCPRLPNEAAPDAAVWKDRLAKEVAAMGDGAILVGHSAGATMAIVAVAEGTITQRLAGLFLVSAPFCGDGGWHIEGLDLPADLHDRMPAGTPIFFYHGRDDETVPIAHVGLYAKSIPGAVVRRLSGRNHQLNDDVSEVAADIKRLE